MYTVSSPVCTILKENKCAGPQSLQMNFGNHSSYESFKKQPQLIPHLGGRSKCVLGKQFSSNTIHGTVNSNVRGCRS